MTIQDTVQITTLERAVSTDVNNMQALINRQLAEVVRTSARALVVDEGNIAPTVTVRPHLASGLNVNQTGGTSIIVNPGILMQQVSPSPPDVPAPDTLDSSYRFGMLMAAEDVGDPWDATNAYWLLEARVERETTLSEIRDIYNPATSTFAPSAAALDKRYESQPEFQWTKGTAAALPATTAGYAPIAGLWRPVGGGAITDIDVFQLIGQIDGLSNLYSVVGENSRDSYRFFGDIDFGVGASNNVQFKLSGEVMGRKLWAKSIKDVVLRHADYIDPTDIGLIATAGVWWYIYLCSVDDRVPSGLYADIEHVGCLVVSRTPPDLYGTNSAGLTVPDPVGGTVNANEAIHIGLFYSTGVGAAVDSIDVSDNGEGMIVPLDLLTMQNGDVPPYQDTNTFNYAVLGGGATELIPYGVHCKMLLQEDTSDPAAVAAAFRFAFDDTGGRQTRYVRLGTDNMGEIEFLFANNNDINLTVQADGLNAASGVIAATNCNANVYKVYLIGFRF
jgi:hypothetical protein